MLDGFNILDIAYNTFGGVKMAAVPIPGGDPMGGGMPPGMPPEAGGMPPPDPAAAMGGLGAAGPMDPAQMQGLPGGLPPEAGGPPSGGGSFTPEQQSQLETMMGGIKDQIAQLGQNQQGGGKKNVEAMLGELSGQIKGVMAALTGFMAGKEGKPLNAVPDIAKLQQEGGSAMGGGADAVPGGGLPGGDPGMGMKAAALYKAASDMSQYIDGLINQSAMRKQASDLPNTNHRFEHLPDFGVTIPSGGGPNAAENLMGAMNAFYKAYPYGKSGLRA